MENSKKSDRFKNNTSITAIVMLVLSFALLFINYESFENCRLLGYSIDLDRYSGLGEFIGGITAPIAIVLLYMTYSSQKKELEMTRKVLTEQTVSMQRQQFESTLFQQIEIYKSIIDSLNRDEFGKQNFIKFTNELSKSLRNKKFPNLSGYFELQYKNYQPLHNTHKENYDYYYRVLYRVFKFIETADFKDEKLKFEYSKMVRAQLSEMELYMLYLNAFSNEGKNFIAIIKKFNLLKHLSIVNKPEFKNILNFTILKQNSANYNNNHRPYFCSQIENAIFQAYQNPRDKVIKEIDTKSTVTCVFPTKKSLEFVIKSQHLVPSSSHIESYLGLTNYNEDLTILFTSIVEDIIVFRQFGKETKLHDLRNKQIDKNKEGENFIFAISFYRKDNEPFNIWMDKY